MFRLIVSLVFVCLVFYLLLRLRLFKMFLATAADERSDLCGLVLL